MWLLHGNIFVFRHLLDLLLRSSIKGRERVVAILYDSISVLLQRDALQPVRNGNSVLRGNSRRRRSGYLFWGFVSNPFNTRHGLVDSERDELLLPPGLHMHLGSATMAA